MALLWVMPTTRRWSPVSKPEWSPNAAFLVFSRASGETADLFLSAADGSGVLTSTPRAFEFEPVWTSG